MYRFLGFCALVGILALSFGCATVPETFNRAEKNSSPDLAHNGRSLDSDIIGMWAMHPLNGGVANVAVYRSDGNAELHEFRCGWDEKNKVVSVDSGAVLNGKYHIVDDRIHISSLPQDEFVELKIVALFEGSKHVMREGSLISYHRVKSIEPTCDLSKLPIHLLSEEEDAEFIESMNQIAKISVPGYVSACEDEVLRFFLSHSMLEKQLLIGCGLSDEDFRVWEAAVTSELDFELANTYLVYVDKATANLFQSESTFQSVGRGVKSLTDQAVTHKTSEIYKIREKTIRRSNEMLDGESPVLVSSDIVEVHDAYLEAENKFAFSFLSVQRYSDGTVDNTITVFGRALVDKKGINVSLARRVASDSTISESQNTMRMILEKLTLSQSIQ